MRFAKKSFLIIGTTSKSFVRINDERIAEFVDAKFDEGVLWPDSILQLNPAYEPGSTLDELAAQGGILKSTADFFRGQGGKPLRLYRHQQQAIETARRWESCTVTTSTGSGKSLTYLISIVDHVLRTQPEKHKVRAIIVYPMNALISSQLKALKTYAENNAGIPIRCYTGQEKEEAKKRIQNDPPHIVLDPGVAQIDLVFGLQLLLKGSVEPSSQRIPSA